MNLPAFIKKINESTSWFNAKQHTYEWLYCPQIPIDLHVEKNSTINEQKAISDYQIGHLIHIAKPPALKDIWQLQTVMGDLYLINASDYIQGLTGIYPYHQEIHTQEWLVLCIEKQLKLHWPQLAIKHLNLVEQLPKKMHYWQLNLRGEYLYLAAAEDVWLHAFKTMTSVPKPKLSAQNIALHFPVLLGQTELTKFEYKHLKKQDIIYLDRAYFNHEGAGFCAIGDWQIQMYYQDQHFFFKQWDATSMSKIENPYDEIFEEDDFEEDQNDEENQTDQDEDGDTSDFYDDRDLIDTDENNDDEDDEGDDDEDDEDLKPSRLIADRLDTIQSSKMGSQKHQVDINEENDQDASEGDAPAIMAPFKNIPVLLNFSLGQLKMTLAELAELSEGALLPLPSNDAAVTIYANHQAVARGEVVMIDERLAVQIKEIFEK
jgi:flagellar motor switch/type III secretory pathway protein FliN